MCLDEYQKMHKSQVLKKNICSLMIVFRELINELNSFESGEVNSED